MNAHRALLREYENIGYGLYLVLDPYGMSMAFHFLVKGETLEYLARLAIEGYMQAGKAAEQDLFLARTTLLLLSTPQPYPLLTGNSLQRARQYLDNDYPEVFEKMMRESGATGPERGEKDAGNTPLVHFLRLFVEALEKKKPELADLLLDKYSKFLDRDPMLMELAIKSKEMYAPSGRVLPPIHGMFGDLFKLSSVATPST